MVHSLPSGVFLANQMPAVSGIGRLLWAGTTERTPTAQPISDLEYEVLEPISCGGVFREG